MCERSICDRGGFLSCSCNREGTSRPSADPLPADLTYAGSRDTYVVQTSYRYVGSGQGDFNVQDPPVAEGRERLWRLVLVAVVFIAFLCGILVWPLLEKLCKPFVPGLAVAGRSHRGAERECMLWAGHARSFDGGFPTFRGEGEFWIVKSRSVKIQGRYLSLPATEDLFGLLDVALGGDFTGGHRLQVGPLQHGRVTCDGKEILQDFPSSATCGPAELFYNGEGAHVGGYNVPISKHALHVKFREHGVRLQFLRWANHLDARITMFPAVGGQDGVCGNVNGDAADDATNAILGRLGGRVPIGDLLFDQQTQASGFLAKTLGDCNQSRRRRALELCRQALPGTGGLLLDSCVFDVCWGGDRFAAEDALTEQLALQ